MLFDNLNCMVQISSQLGGFSFDQHLLIFQTGLLGICGILAGSWAGGPKRVLLEQLWAPHVFLMHRAAEVKVARSLAPMFFKNHDMALSSQPWPRWVTGATWCWGWRNRLRFLMEGVAMFWSHCVIHGNKNEGRLLFYFSPSFSKCWSNFIVLGSIMILFRWPDSISEFHLIFITLETIHLGYSMSDQKHHWGVGVQGTMLQNPGLILYEILASWVSC